MSNDFTLQLTMPTERELVSNSDSPDGRSSRTRERLFAGAAQISLTS